ncbi:hypothetical protein SMY55_002537 [Cronobacter sakazakii]|nr:hypothetical protein [Cronobacter sakazakii]
MAAGTFDLVDFLSKAGVGLITGVGAAIVTAKVALNRFYHEKWWEKKHSSYTELIDMLFEIKAIYSHASDFYQAQYEAMAHGKQQPKGSVDWDKFHQLNAQLQRAYVLTPISLSQNTRELLSKFFKKNAESEHSVYEEGYPDFIAYNDMTLVTQELIDAIVLDAGKELKFK